MPRFEALLIFVVTLLLKCLDCKGFEMDSNLKKFVGTLEKFQNRPADIVFLLDESGSIGVEVFPREVLFTELIARIITMGSTTNRAAVVTFSTGHIVRFNYIENSEDNNMCTFVPDLWKIDYKGGGTNTADALKVAEQILRRGRANAEKIIILISDGQSNDGAATVNAATNLRQSNHIIFAVGVADINEKELISIATGQEYIYILKNFEHIEEINEKLRKDTKEIHWDLVKDSNLCNSFCNESKDCCDSNAACYCGTKGGSYECACNPGYFGGGGKGKCSPCPKGTYSSDSTKQSCISCPTHSTTFHERSTKREDCVCLSGYEGDPTSDSECRAVECAKLLSPEGGTILPDQCGNIFNSTCTFICHEGYCPYACNNSSNFNIPPWRIPPKESRKCLEDKKWSGVEFYCEKIKCPSLNYPNFGDHNCSESDFGFGTVCEINCNKGFILHGSKTRQCQVTGEWDGKDTICKAVTCPPLKVNKLLTVKPKPCHTLESIYDTVCQYYCNEGYKLVSIDSTEGELAGIRKCLKNGKWSGKTERITCIDNSPPSLHCPPDIHILTDRHQPTALVEWKLPKAVDNIKVVELKVLSPPKLYKPPHSFNIGTNRVTYIAFDRIGLNATCSFTVVVKDVERPRVEYCPKDIIKEYSKNDGVAVTWKEPIFIDNSGKIKGVDKTRKSGDEFFWGPSAPVLYRASDPSGNIANCGFSVTVKQYQCEYAPPPLNGAVACETWLGGVLCTVYCEEGYDFAEKPEEEYMCRQLGGSAEWGRVFSSNRRKQPFKFPWPDCGKKQLPRRLRMKMKLRYYTGTCPSKEATLQIQENFIKLFDKYPDVAGFCPKEHCIPENVIVKCRKINEAGGNNALGRKKRNSESTSSNELERVLEEWEPQYSESRVYMNETSKLEVISKQNRFKREENSFEIDIDWEIYTSSNKTEPSESCKECEDQTEFYFDQDNLTNKLNELHSLSSTELSEHIPGLSLSPIYENISFVLIPECDFGQVAQNLSCVNCPLGTFYSKILSECQPCSVGTFQNKEASSFCKRCPSGFSTLSERSKSIEDCKKFCSPGSYSETGMEYCQACPAGTYQHLPAQISCHNCTEGATTWTIGSVSVSDCTTMCPPGTYSNTGFHPCRPCSHGTYQPSTQATECLFCSSGLTTRVEGAHAPEYCQVVDFCEDLTPCMNGGTCMNTGDTYKCSCLDGFEGKDCEINIDDCSLDLCLNNGTCVDDVNGYHCVCFAGFTGQICETNIDDCNSESCLNGGTCIDGINKFVCKCQNGFTGNTCEINYYDCASDPCRNGGTCFDEAGSFRCCCPKGYTGKFCEEEIHECSNVDCYNGGTCIDKLRGYECLCKKGFKGKHCEKNIEDCQNHLCKNNGLCIDGISNYTCQCPSTYAGYHCERELSTKFGLQFPQAITSNYVKLQNKKSLSAVTVSFWMRTDYKNDNNRGTPISYSFWNPITRKEVDNGLTLLDTNKFVFYLHGEEFYTDVIANSDQNWHHCAITWESLSGDWLLYWDGVVRLKGSGVAVGSRLWGGYFVIGQEQDGVGVAFSTRESYKGEISQFNVWDHILSSQTIQELRNKCGLLGNVIAWTDVLNNLYGSVIVIENVDLCLDIKECTKEDCYCPPTTKSLSENCWRSIPTCEPNPCTGGQQCLTKDDGTSECKCTSGFEGIFCQYDVDECVTNNGNCSHFCTNTHGSYSCSCPVGMRLAADKHNCIDLSFCNDNGLVYLNGEIWTKKCEECKCEQGEIICIRKPCPMLHCKENESEALFPGECCNSCFGGYLSCTLHHKQFITFDNAEYDFSGNCRYSLMDDCFDGQFSVQYENLEPKTEEKTIFIYVHCVEVQIMAPGTVFVDGDEVEIPYRSSSLLHIIPVVENSVSALFIYTAHRIVIKWESSGRIEIKVPPKYKREICGLCGNFNDKRADDFQTKQHLPARTVKDLGMSWKVNGYKYCRKVTINPPRNRIQITHYDTCETSSYYMQQKARKQCSLLKREQFIPCYKHSNPLPYYKRCLQDSCSCMHNEQCYCDSIMAYIAECKRHKVDIKYQKVVAHCAIKCKGGTVFAECGPACVETCEMDLMKPSCRNEPCVPGCHCPAGQVLHNRKCIYKSNCPTYNYTVFRYRNKFKK